MATAFDLLHRNVQRKLWDMQWTELRSIQDQAIRHLLLGGRDAVIASPTASGKTEAAFLPVLSAIADSAHGSVRAMYIGPLKALINDQFPRVEDLCGRLEMPVCKWHGDVGDGAKKRLRETPSGILLITPESLEAMLVLRPTEVPTLFGRLGFVVVDEMHAFMGTERGAQLVSQLHRLSARAGCDPVRIGLSATLGDPESALRWLRPGGPPAKLIHDTSAASDLKMRVRGIWETPPTEEDEAPTQTELARAILLACGGKTNLVFANAKSRIELLADALTTEVAAMNLADEIVVHHGSLSRESRHHAEARLREAAACTAVCSNTLELGIDIGNIDDVVQVSAPWSVASLLQRVGRSGRRDAPRVLRGFFVEERPDENSELWDRLHLGLIQGIATTELMLEKFVEPPRLGRAHLSTVIHQCLAFVAETGGATALSLYERVCGSGAFGEVARGDFVSMLRELGKSDLLEQMGDGSLVLGMAGQKLVDHYSFFAAFNAPEELRVVHGSEEIGRVGTPPAPGEFLVLAGRRWRVEDVDIERREVLVSPARGRKSPWFVPSFGNVHTAIHGKMKELLLGTSEPSYLDATALEILASARREAARLEGFTPPAITSDGKVRLFVFGGSKVQQTLYLILSRAGLQLTNRGVGFDVDAELSNVGAALRAFALNPELSLLAEHADQVLKMRTLGPEKFDRFVSPDVWRKAFAREELDAIGAARAAFALSDAAAAAAAPVAIPQIRSARHTLHAQPISTLTDLCELIAHLPVANDLPSRLILVPSEAHAHAIRRELALRGPPSVLLGTRLLTIPHLAVEVLQDAGVDFVGGEEAARPARLRALFRTHPSLRYFRADRLHDTPGWDHAVARTIADLEAGGLPPELVARGVDDPRARDIADLWATIDAAAASSWTAARIVHEACRVLEEEPSYLSAAGPVIVAFTGHEHRVEIDFACAIPGAVVALWSARPTSSEHAQRLERLFGPDARDVQTSALMVASPAREIDLLKAFLFDAPSRLVALDRPRSLGRDETVEIEQHDSVDAEIEAALTWVQHEVTRHGTSCEDIALLVPRIDPLGALLADRLNELGLPAYVLGGRPVTSSPVGARLLVLLRALTSHLHRDRLVDLLPSLRVERTPRGHLTRSEALDIVTTLGVLGGTRANPRGALEWPTRIATRLTQIESALERRKQTATREEELYGLERLRDLLRLVEAPIEALARVAESFLRGDALEALWSALEPFVREYLLLPEDGTPILPLFAAAMQTACSQPALAGTVSVDAHLLLEEMLRALRIDSGRFGDAAIAIATIDGAAGLPFTAVRVLGMAEGTFPSTPREDPVLPEDLRNRLCDADLHSRSDDTLAQLHALHRVVQGTRARVVLSAPRRGLEGGYRDLSSVGIEAAIALGRDGIIVPGEKDLRLSAFEPAQRVLDVAREHAPLREASWHLRAAQRGECSPRWEGGAHLDLSRGRSLLDRTAEIGAHDGLFPTEGWFPTTPGMTPERPLSASRWRTFLECPHRFLLEVILRFEAPSEAPDDGALEPLAYGDLFHTVAERFYAAHGDAFVAHPKDLAIFESKARAIADEALAESLDAYALAGASVRTAQRERLLADVRCLLQHDADLSRQKVIGVELLFGTTTEAAIATSGRPVYVRGYIDRIDIEGGVAVLRDLKTGKPRPRKDEIDPAIDAQLALYALIARTLKGEWGLPERMAAAYVYPAGVRHTERAFRGDEFTMLAEHAAAWVNASAGMMADRSFPRTASAEDCSRCAFTAVCGPRVEARALHVLESAGARLAAFRKVREQ